MTGGRAIDGFATVAVAGLLLASFAGGYGTTALLFDDDGVETTIQTADTFPVESLLGVDRVIDLGSTTVAGRPGHASAIESTGSPTVDLRVRTASSARVAIDRRTLLDALGTTELSGVTGSVNGSSPLQYRVETAAGGSWVVFVLSGGDHRIQFSAPAGSIRSAVPESSIGSPSNVDHENDSSNRSPTAAVTTSSNGSVGTDGSPSPDGNSTDVASPEPENDEANTTTESEAATSPIDREPSDGDPVAGVDPSGTNVSGTDEPETDDRTPENDEPVSESVSDESTATGVESPIAERTPSSADSDSSNVDDPNGSPDPDSDLDSGSEIVEKPEVSDEVDPETASQHRATDGETDATSSDPDGTDGMDTSADSDDEPYDSGVEP